MNDLRRTYRIAVIIGLIMMASLAAYMIVVSLFENGTIALRGAAELPGSAHERLRFVFLGITIVIFFLLRSVNRMVLNAADERRTMRDAWCPPSSGWSCTSWKGA